jgi:hypothetical protein
MLSENLKENSDSNVNIVDCTYDEIILVLVYLCCDSLSLDLETALNLLKVNIFTNYLDRR